MLALARAANCPMLLAGLKGVGPIKAQQLIAEPPSSSSSSSRPSPKASLSLSIVTNNAGMLLSWAGKTIPQLRGMNMPEGRRVCLARPGCP